MKERPILFSGEMVRAILDDRKTQTRRVIKVPRRCRAGGVRDYYPAHRWWVGPHPVSGWWAVDVPDGPPEYAVKNTRGPGFSCPYGRPGDLLWVRETWAHSVTGCEDQGGVTYRADHLDPAGDGPANPVRWRPSIHMPRWASRLSLMVTNVRAEPLQDITAADARAEGIQIPTNSEGTPLLCITERVKTHPLWADPGEATLDDYWTGYFALKWNQINGRRYPWKSGPWVWVVEFEVEYE